MALQGEGGAEESFALLALEGSFLGVGLRRRARACVSRAAPPGTMVAMTGEDPASWSADLLQQSSSKGA